MEIQLYKALLEAGIGTDTAQRVVESVGKEINDKINERANTLATKADLSELKAELIKWNVGTLIAVAGIVLTIAKFVLAGNS